jgi:hypothetical protein
LTNLQTSFQNLISTLAAAFVSSASSSATPSLQSFVPPVPPTLQSFLQNLQTDLSGGQNIAGAVVNTQA